MTRINYVYCSDTIFDHNKPATKDMTVKSLQMRDNTAREDMRRSASGFEMGDKTDNNSGRKEQSRNPINLVKIKKMDVEKQP